MGNYESGCNMLDGRIPASCYLKKREIADFLVSNVNKDDSPVERHSNYIQARPVFVVIHPWRALCWGDGLKSLDHRDDS